MISDHVPTMWLKALPVLFHWVLVEWEVLIKQRIYWIEGQESIRISQWSQRIKGSLEDHKLPKLCDKIKGCSDRNCRMFTFQGLQREMDRVGVGPTRVNFSLNPHHTYFTLNGCWSWMSYTISFPSSHSMLPEQWYKYY